MKIDVCPICAELDDFERQEVYQCSNCKHHYCTEHFEFNDGKKQLCDNCFVWQDYSLVELKKYARKYYWEGNKYCATDLKVALK